MDGEEKIHELIALGEKEEILRTQKPNEEICADYGCCK